LKKLTLIVNDQMHIAQSMLKDTERHLFISAYAKTDTVDWLAGKTLMQSFTLHEDNSEWKQTT